MPIPYGQGFGLKENRQTNMNAATGHNPLFDPFFDPRAIALMGASSNPQKWGFRILANILAGGYSGTLYPVNPKGGTLLGLPVYPSLHRLPGPADLAIISIPAPSVPHALTQCGEAGIRSVIIISSGFSESGPEGAAREQAVASLARAHGIRILGPNTMGVFSAKCRLNALMPPLTPRAGGVSYVSQSGNLGVQMLGWGELRGVGFSKFVSSGNESDIRCEDYLTYFAHDPDTRVIMAYVEGVSDGRRFMEAAEHATRAKPMIVFKSGKAPETRQAVQSHSGSMAGSYTLYRSAFRQKGIIEALRTDTMLDYAAAFLHYPLPKGNQVAIMTRGGGWGVVTADACRDKGLALATLSQETLETMNRVLPPYWSRSNPADLVATLNPEAFPVCLEALIRDEGVDGIIALGAESGNRAQALADKLQQMKVFESTEPIDRRGGPEDIHLAMDLMHAYGKPVILVSGLSSYAKAVAHDGRETVLFPTPERAAGAMAALWRYSRFRRRL
jgi:acyl-CoA synthetase (NDP forming)